jgi:DNA-binding transcriptional ArsR family regulator
MSKPNAKMSKTNKTELIEFNGGNEKIEVKFPDLRKMMLTTRALEHDLRKKIIDILSDDRKLTVTELYLKLKVEQSVASQHLAILRKSGVVDYSRDGKFIYYSLNKLQLERIASFIDELI